MELPQLQSTFALAFAETCGGGGGGTAGAGAGAAGGEGVVAGLLPSDAACAAAVGAADSFGPSSFGVHDAKKPAAANISTSRNSA